MTELKFGSSKRQPSLPPVRRVLTMKDLPAKGIQYHPNHLRRLWQRGDFPEPFYPSARKCAWFEDVIDQWLDDKAAEQQTKIDERNKAKQEQKLGLRG